MLASHFGRKGWAWALLALASVFPVPVSAQVIPCPSLTPVPVADDDYPIVELPGHPQTFTVSDGLDPIVAIRIGPPDMLSALDDYACGVDYGATRVGGDIDISFSRNGSYLIDLDRLSSAREIILVNVDAESTNGCKVGKAKEFNCPAPTKAFAGSDLQAGRDRFGGTTVTCAVMDTADLVKQVCALGGLPVDLFLVDHGSPGSIDIGGNSSVSCAKADAANFAKFCQLKGKVSSVTFLSCSTGSGAAGAAFLKKVSKCLNGVPTTGYTGTVTNWDDGKKRWSVSGTSTTETEPAAGGGGGAVPETGTGGGGAFPSILPPDPFSSSINCPNDIDGLSNVTIDGLNHTWIGDLQIVLCDPTGKAHNLMCRPGYDSAGPNGNDGDVTGNYHAFVETGGALVPDAPGLDMPEDVYDQHFGDLGGLPWPNGAAGICNTPLSQIAGPAGVWTLKIYDWSEQEAGLIAGWSLLPASGPPAPINYCTAGTSANGCQALLSATGVPSATASSGFQLNANGVEGDKDGLYFFGTNGPQANSWGSGTSFQCVVPPVFRAGLLVGGGTTGLCDGSFSQDLNALWCATCPKPLKNPGAGAVVQAQLWYRDPQNTSNQTTSLSDAIQFTVGP